MGLLSLHSQGNVLSKKKMYSQKNSVGTDRENIAPGNLCIIWKLDEALTTEKRLGHFLKTLKASKTHKKLHHCLTTLRAFNTEKRTPSLSYDF